MVGNTVVPAEFSAAAAISAGVEAEPNVVSPLIQSENVHSSRGNLRHISIPYSWKLSRRWTGVTPLAL